MTKREHIENRIAYHKRLSKKWFNVSFKHSEMIESYKKQLKELKREEKS